MTTSQNGSHITIRWAAEGWKVDIVLSQQTKQQIMDIGRAQESAGVTLLVQGGGQHQLTEGDCEVVELQVE